MKIEKIKIQNEGYVYCRSGFYTAFDVPSKNNKYEFVRGINKLIGEIDSGNWAISYLLSMYTHKPEDFTLFEEVKVFVNDEIMSVDKLAEYSCYIDETYPLFSTDFSIRELVKDGIEKNKLNYSPDDIKDLFCIDSQRFERPVKCVGNERFRAMSAIGFCNNKEIYCFPWLSHHRYEAFHRNLSGLMEILESLNKIVIVPIGKKD